jgi:hypothetical protein
MKELLEYRDNSYFNDKDHFLFYYPSFDKLYINRVSSGDKGGTFYSKFHKEFNTKQMFWYNAGPFEFKLTSLPSINCNELINQKVSYKNTDLTGRLGSHLILNNIGVHWDKSLNSTDFKKWGFPYFWNNPNDLKLLL